MSNKNNRLAKRSAIIGRAIRKVCDIEDKLPFWNLVGQMKCGSHLTGLNGLETRLRHLWDGGSLIIWQKKAGTMKIRK